MPVSSVKPIFRALLFDMDGVLADTEQLHFRAWRQTLGRLNPEARYDSRGNFMGMATAEIAVEMVRIYGLDVTPSELVSLKRAAFRAIIDAELRPFDGLLDELAWWAGYPRGLATSSAREETERMLRLLGFEGMFAPIVTSDDVQKAKPAPGCYLLAAEKLGRKPGECVVLEDSWNGMTAAVSAGCQVLAINVNGLEKFPDGIHAVFPSTVEALRWLRGA